MDTWKFFDVTHRKCVVCNPTSEEKLARLVDLVYFRQPHVWLTSPAGRANSRYVWRRHTECAA